VIEAFGAFVIRQCNFAVGLVVFAILVIIINFMVVTKGAGRIAESGRGLRWMRCRASKWPLTPI